MINNGCGYSGPSKHTEIGCMSKRNYWNKLVFGVLIKIVERQKLL